MARSQVHGSKFNGSQFGFKVQGSRFKVHGSRFMVHGSWFMVLGSWFARTDP
jgi:hypothetical protein